MGLPTQTVSPKAAPFPPLPAEDPFTEAQWRTLFAIADAVIPAVRPIAAADARTEHTAKDDDYSTAIATLKGRSELSNEEIARAYLEESASSIPEFREGLFRTFGSYMPLATKKELAMVLNVLE